MKLILGRLAALALLVAGAALLAVAGLIVALWLIQTFG